MQAFVETTLHGLTDKQVAAIFWRVDAQLDTARHIGGQAHYRIRLRHMKTRLAEYVLKRIAD